MVTDHEDPAGISIVLQNLLEPGRFDMAFSSQIAVQRVDEDEEEILSAHEIGQTCFVRPVHWQVAANLAEDPLAHPS